MRRRRVTVWIVGGCALVGAIAVASVGLVLNGQSAGGTTLVSGFRTAGETFDLGGRTIDRGRYVTGYSLDVRFVSSTPGARLQCALVDLSGALLAIDQPERSAVADGSWTTLGFEDTRELPEATLSIRCSPSVSGEISASFRNLTILTTPTEYVG